MSDNNIVWPEIQKVFETKRYELCLVGPEISKRIEDNQGNLDSNLFKLKHLNFLEIAKTKLSLLPKELSLNENLTSLLCYSNELTSIPSEIGKLVHLKNLDLSNNKLTELPEDLKNLKELMTVNLGGNQLTSLFPLENLTKLAVLDINRNKFKKLPKDLGSEVLENLSQINASFNELEELDDTLVNLPSLKLFNLENNKLTEVPSNLSQCSKLKDLLLKENRLKDNRLKKLVEQDKCKQVIEYLERIYVEECKKKPKIAKEQAPGKKKSKNKETIVEYDLIKVHHFQDEKMQSREVVISESVVGIRPYIICAILREIDLETSGNLKKFLNIQTKLHEELCQKRTLATIATHDLTNVTGNLSYEAGNPDGIELVPLGRKYPVTASEFYGKLWDEAEAERKAKKRNQLSGIYKYLTLLENQTKFVYLKDSKDIISLPPLTNAEKTKMSPSTKNVLVEITSSENIDICKKVIEKMIFEMIQAGLVSKPELTDKVEALSINSEKTDNQNSNGNAEAQSSDDSKLRHTILVQQVKVVDSEGKLKSVYPSRVDLNFEDPNKLRVVRLYDEN